MVEAISAAATGASDVSKHPLMANAENRTRAAVVVVTADRGLAGAYSANAIREAGYTAVPLPASVSKGDEPVAGKSWCGHCH